MTNIIRYKRYKELTYYSNKKTGTLLNLDIFTKNMKFSELRYKLYD